MPSRRSSRILSALEREIFKKLGFAPESKRRVLETLSFAVQISFDYAGWWEQVEALQKGIRSRLGDQNPSALYHCLTNYARKSLEVSFPDPATTLAA